jgi:hypothetical protein
MLLLQCSVTPLSDTLAALWPTRPFNITSQKHACSGILKRLVKNPCRAPVACVLLKFLEHNPRRCCHDFNSGGATWKRTHFSIGSRHVFVFFAKQDVICHLLSKPFGTFFDPGLVPAKPPYSAEPQEPFCELPIRPTCAGGWRSAF